MISKPLKLGFIGGSLDSAIGTTHRIASQMDNKWELCAGCFSTDLEKNIQTAQKWGIEKKRNYADWKSLLLAEKGKLDAIVVLTPTPNHDEIVIEALKNSYPVICEKALTTCSRKAQKIKKILHEKKGFLAVTYNYTGYPMLRELKSLIERGGLGELNQIQIEMPQEGFCEKGDTNKQPQPQSWRLQDNEVSTLSLDLGVHIHHLIHFLSNATPLELVATSNTFGFFDDVVDNIMCIAKYSENIDCQIWLSKSALGHSNGLRIRVYGSKSSAEWFQQNPETLSLNDNTGRKTILTPASTELDVSNHARYNRFKPGHPTGFIEAFANYYSDLGDAISEYKKGKGGESPWIFGIHEALEGLVMLEAIADSIKNKRWEKVSIPR